MPAAAAYESPAKAIERAERWFAALGASISSIPVYRRAEANDRSAIDRVRAAKFIYLTDGSAAHLRSVLKDTELLDAIVETWRAGAVLAAAGQSATALCEVMVDPRGGAFTVGLGVITELTVIPHFDQWSKDKLHRTLEMAPARLAVAGIDDHTALVRDPQGQWSAAGSGRVEVHRDHRPLALAELSSR